MTLNESADLNHWAALDANSLTVDARGIVLPINPQKGFWDLEVLHTVPDPTPIKPLQIEPNPDANFQETPWQTSTTGGGGGEQTLAPFNIPQVPVAFPGPHAFNK